MKKLSIILILITCSIISAQEQNISITPNRQDTAEVFAKIYQAARDYVNNIRDKGIALKLNVHEGSPSIKIRGDVWTLSSDKAKKTLISMSAIYTMYLYANEYDDTPEMFTVSNEQGTPLGLYFYSDFSTLIVE